VTAQANATEILARANAALAPPAYDMGKVPATRPPEFVEMTLTRRFGGVPTLSGEKCSTGYRFTLAAVSQVSMANVRNSLQKCRDEFENELLTVGDFESTPIEFETEDEADYGSGWFSQYAAYTYVIDEI
jgi:hypothetical protein